MDPQHDARTLSVARKFAACRSVSDYGLSVWRANEACNENEQSDSNQKSAIIMNICQTPTLPKPPVLMYHNQPVPDKPKIENFYSR